MLFGLLPDWKCFILCLCNRDCARGCGFVGRCYCAGYCGFAELSSVGGTGESPRLGNHSLSIFGIFTSVARDIEQGMNIDFEMLLEACYGLAGTVSLALNFVIIRKNKIVPFELVIGLGALIAGCTAFYLWPAAWQVRGASLIYISSRRTDYFTRFFFFAVKGIAADIRSQCELYYAVRNGFGPFIGLAWYRRNA